MIQRIQTVYLMLAFALCVVCMCVSVGYFYTEEGERVGDLYNLWVHLADGHRSLKPWALFVLLLIPSTLTFFSIFMFRRRAAQMRMCVFNMILLVGWYICYGVFAYILGGVFEAHFRPSIMAAIPFASIIFLYLAFRGIMKDEMLVRSLDRLRP